MHRKHISIIRRLFTLCCLIGIALIAGLIGGRYWVHSEHGQSVIRQKLAARDVHVRRLHWTTIWPTRFDLTDTRVTAKAGETAVEVLAKYAKVTIKPWRLLGGTLKVAELRLPQLRINTAPAPPSKPTNPEGALPLDEPRPFIPLRTVSIDALRIDDLQLATPSRNHQGAFLGNGTWHLHSGKILLNAELKPHPSSTASPFPSSSLHLRKDAQELHLDWGLSVDSMKDGASIPLNAPQLTGQVHATGEAFDRFWAGEEKTLPFQFAANLAAGDQPQNTALAILHSNRCLPAQIGGYGILTAGDQLDINVAQVEVFTPIGKARGSGGIAGETWRQCQLEMEISSPISLPKPFRSLPATRGILRWNGPLFAPNFSYSLLPFGRKTQDLISEWQLKLERYRQDPTKWLFDLLKEDRPSPSSTTTANSETAHSSRQVASGEITFDWANDAQFAFAARGMLPKLSPIEGVALEGFFSVASSAQFTHCPEGELRSGRASLTAQVETINSDFGACQNAKLNANGGIALHDGEVLTLDALVKNGESHWEISSKELRTGFARASDVAAIADQHALGAEFTLCTGQLLLQDESHIPAGDLHVAGSWSGEDRAKWQTTLHSLQATFGNYSLRAARPLRFEQKGDTFEIPQMDLELGDGTLTAALSCDKTQMNVKVDGQALPLCLFEPWTNAQLQGSGFGKVHLVSDAKKFTLTGQMYTQDAQLLLDEDAQQFSAQLALDATNHGVQATLAGSFLETPLKLEGTLPFVKSPSSPVFTLDPKGNCQLTLAMSGDISPLTALLLPEGNSARGQLAVSLRGDGPLNHPNLEGFIEVRGGEFSHQGANVHLIDIDGKLIAHKKTLSWENINAKDRERGTFQSRGEAKFWPQMSLQSGADFTNASYSYSEFAQGHFSGQLQLFLEGAERHLKGSVRLEDAKIAIPEDVPTTLPLIIKRPNHALKEPPTSSPLHLDIAVDIPPKVLISGRGLNSNWGGELHLGGSSAQPTLHGALELQRGTFTFCGRAFRIAESYLHIGSDVQGPEIRLVGEYPVEGATVRAIFQGPLRGPELTFDSYPQLSLNEMLSRVLFDTSFNAINPVQALQVADAALMVSGKSLTPIGQFRRSVKLDQIDVHLPGESEDKKLVLQVGKYLKNGVLVGVKQSFAPEGTDVFTGTQLSVELRLKKHLHVKTEVGYLSENTVSLLWKRDY